MFLIQKIVRGKKLLSQLNLEDDEASTDGDDDDDPSTSDVADGVHSAQQQGDTVDHADGGSNCVRGGGGARRMRRSSSLPSCSDALLLSAAGLPSSPQPGLASSSSSSRAVDEDPSVERFCTEPDLSALTVFQKRAIRFTWNRMKQQSSSGKSVEAVMENVFGRMVRKTPAVKEMFMKKCLVSWMEGDSEKQSMTVKSHAKFTALMLDHLISRIERKRNNRRSMPEMFDPQTIGGAHQYLKPLGFLANYWELFGEALTDELFTNEAIRDMPGAPKAWMILAACLVDLMRAGFDRRTSAALRRRSAFTHVHHHISNADLTYSIRKRHSRREVAATTSEGCWGNSAGASATARASESCDSQGRQHSTLSSQQSACTVDEGDYEDQCSSSIDPASTQLASG